MKKSFALILALFALRVEAAFPQTEKDLQDHRTCKYCNMDRQHYAYSRMLIEYEDGTVFGACSLHCAAIDLALNIYKTPKSIQVGDYSTGKLIDAENACWVIGGNRSGVMTKRAKWAFEKKKDAEKFIQEMGGGTATFDEALKATYEDMYSDTKMIRNKKKIKKMGQT